MNRTWRVGGRACRHADAGPRLGREPLEETLTESVAAGSTPFEPHQRQQQELARHLTGVRERLEHDFNERLDRETVERELARVTAQFSDARIKAYVPVLVDRQVRLDLRQLTRAS